jgi:hypothetical protein
LSVSSNVTWTTSNYCSIEWGHVKTGHPKAGDCILPAREPKAHFADAFNQELARKFTSEKPKWATGGVAVINSVRLAAEGSRSWVLAGTDTAFVGVFDVKEGVIMLAPLVPRLREGRTDRYESTPMPNEQWQEEVPGVEFDNETFNRLVNLSKPIEHKPAAGAFANKTSHEQLGERYLFRDQSFGTGTGSSASPSPMPTPQRKRDDFLGFAIKKRAGSKQDPHQITVQSITLNDPKFAPAAANVNEGIEKVGNIPAVWALVLKNALEIVLPASQVLAVPLPFFAEKALAPTAASSSTPVRKKSISGPPSQKGKASK